MDRNGNHVRCVEASSTVSQPTNLNLDKLASGYLMDCLKSQIGRSYSWVGSPRVSPELVAHMMQTSNRNGSGG